MPSALLRLAERAEAGPGGVRTVALDGRSGAGKTTLARALARHTGAPRVALDAIYPGWQGLRPGVELLVEWVLRPLADGSPARYRRFDWPRQCFAEWHDVRPSPLVIVEGVGAAARICRPYLQASVWVEAAADVRRTRSLARDGAAFRPHWSTWAATEDAYLADDDPASGVDLILRT